MKTSSGLPKFVIWLRELWLVFLRVLYDPIKVVKRYFWSDNFFIFGDGLMYAPPFCFVDLIFSNCMFFLKIWIQAFHSFNSYALFLWLAGGNNRRLAYVPYHFMRLFLRNLRKIVTKVYLSWVDKCACCSSFLSQWI